MSSLPCRSSTSCRSTSTSPSPASRRPSCSRRWASSTATSAPTPSGSPTTASATGPARPSRPRSSSPRSTSWSASAWSRSSRCAGPRAARTSCFRSVSGSSTTSSPTTSTGGTQRSPERPTAMPRPRSSPRLSRSPEGATHGRARARRPRRDRRRRPTGTRQPPVDAAAESTTRLIGPGGQPVDRRPPAARPGVHPARLTPSACYRPIAAVVGPVEDTMSPVRSLNDTELLSRILVGFALAFLIGFERELRGSPAGDRTFALIGSAAASAAAVTGQASPQALAGIVTGVGFIGGGLILKGRDGDVRGVTTAATVFATAVVGLVVGLGHLLMGVVAAGLTLLILELRFLPGIRLLDAHRYQSRVRPDDQGPG